MYLTMGWGALFCYFELAKRYSHATLLPLPLGGLFYSVGAILNLMQWPVFLPGVLGAHEIAAFPGDRRQRVPCLLHGQGGRAIARFRATAVHGHRCGDRRSEDTS